jgi:predicted RNase H-like HicB family nuclease
MEKQKKYNYFAISLKDNETVIAKGETIESVVAEASEKEDDYIIAPVLEENTTYIL